MEEKLIINNPEDIQNILSILVIGIISSFPCLAGYATKSIINAKKIKKEYDDIYCNIDIKNPPIIKNNNVFDINNITAIEYKDHILKFIKTIENNVNKDYLKYLYYNLNSLKIITSDFKKGDNYITEGSYNCVDNCIQIPKKFSFLNLNHELLHASSNVYLDDVYYSGFLYNDGNNDFTIGRGLNEGYTQYLNRKYFYSETDKINDGRKYVVEMYIAEYVEKLITAEKMQELYFTANLNGLIEELEKYDSRENIIKFLKQLDFVLANRYYYNSEFYKKKLVNKSFNDVMKYILTNYVNEFSKESSQLISEINNTNFDVNAFENVLCLNKNN